VGIELASLSMPDPVHGRLQVSLSGFPSEHSSFNPLHVTIEVETSRGDLERMGVVQQYCPDRRRALMWYLCWEVEVGVVSGSPGGSEATAERLRALGLDTWFEPPDEAGVPAGFQPVRVRAVRRAFDPSFLARIAKVPGVSEIRVTTVPGPWPSTPVSLAAMPASLSPIRLGMSAISVGVGAVVADDGLLQLQSGDTVTVRQIFHQPSPGLGVLTLVVS
jgi:hypothetical protein